MDIVIPAWNAAAGLQCAPSTLASLRGARLALLDDNYDAPFTDEIEAQLTREHGALVTRLVKPNGSQPSPLALIDAAAACRVAVVGIAM